MGYCAVPYPGALSPILNLTNQVLMSNLWMSESVSYDPPSTAWFDVTSAQVCFWSRPLIFPTRNRPGQLGRRLLKWASRTTSLFGASCTTSHLGLCSFLFLQFFGAHEPFLWGHLYPCFGLLVMSALFFESQSGYLTCMLCSLLESRAWLYKDLNDSHRQPSSDLIQSRTLEWWSIGCGIKSHWEQFLMKFILLCVTLDLSDNLTEMRIVKN